MKLSREDKEQIVDDLQQRIDESQVVGILDMHSLPAKQLQQIRKEMTGDADIRMARKSLMYLALDQSDKDNIQELKENKAIQPAFIFSDANPFRLYSIIKENKTSAAASGGEIAPNDVVIEEGDTGIGPGPMIGKLNQLGAQTSVEDGSIKVMQEAVAVEEGEVIDDETADILNQLGMEPLEVGLDLKLVHEKGEILGKDALDIDEDQYRQDLEGAASQAFNLAVNAGYLTEQTAESVVVDELRKVRNLAVNAALPEKEVIEDILAKATGEAQALESQLDLEAADEADDGDEDDETNSEDSEDDGSEEE
ncbi:MAG: 50S ribosomal protein L10 [Candidatus Nanohaloarchaea archaeon]|nr:50S ribosomal protein L10 [Candidatus Nanohaloarchaea archaeon]